MAAPEITPELLEAAVGCTPAAAARYAPHLAEACRVYRIDTPTRLAPFLAQLAHESGALRYSAELWGPTGQQRRYERNFDQPWPSSPLEAKQDAFEFNRLAYTLGNSERGDGARFAGHGPIQVTGRTNHAAARDRMRQRLGADVPDFVLEPQRLAEPRWGALAAGDFWDTKGLNQLADRGDQFEAITRRINGGVNGLADREARLERATFALARFSPAPAIAQTPAQDLARAPIAEAPVPVPQPSIPTPATDPQENPPMIPVLLAGLASSLINAFAPLAREKVSQILERHTEGSPQVVDQVSTSIVELAKTITGKADPIEAVVAARSDPAIIRQVEQGALDELERLAPLLDKLAAWDREAWGAEEDSRTAAAARSKADATDIGPMLAHWAVKGLYGMIVLLGLIVIAQVIFTDEHKPSGELLTALTGLMMLAAGKSNTVYDYRFGASRSNSAKDVVINELARRPKA